MSVRACRGFPKLTTITFDAPQISAVEPIQRPEVQEMLETIDDQIRRVTIGYALMTVMDEDDLGRGPRMQRQCVNLRNINETFIQTFVEGVEEHGLQNKVVENAMDVGVFEADIDVLSVDPARASIYTNRVRWNNITSESTSVLYNGNHRFHYMRFSSEVRRTYNQRTKAKKELDNNPTFDKATGLNRVIAEADSIISTDGVWLIRFLNLGESWMVSSAIQRQIMLTSTCLS